MTTNLHDKMLKAIDALFSASNEIEAHMAEEQLLDVRDEINKHKRAEQPRAVGTLAQQEQETRIAKLEAELMRMQGRELKLQFALAGQPRAEGTLAQLIPLTDEQIEIGRRAPWGEALDPFTAGVRFAETKHGITKGGEA